MTPYKIKSDNIDYNIRDPHNRSYNNLGRFGYNTILKVPNTYIPQEFIVFSRNKSIMNPEYTNTEYNMDEIRNKIRKIDKEEILNYFE